MPIAELFDGTELEFPEGTDPLVIENTVKKLTAERNPQGQPQSGGIASFKSALHDIAGQGALTLGKVGLMHPEEAQKKYEENKQKSAGIFKPTEKGWTEDPITKTLELLGGSVPYMAAPLVGAVAAPEIIGGSLVGAGLASGAQFVGSNLGRQLDEGQKEGKKLADTSLTSAVAASIPQALLDTYSLKMTPLIRGIFGKAGKEITDKTAEQIAKKGILGTITDVGLTANREGITEAGQQVLERLQAGLNITDEEARKEYFDSYIGGAVLGGVLGTGGHFIEKSMQNNEESRYDSLMNNLRTHFDSASDVPMTDVINKITELTGETDLNKIQNFLGGAQDRGHLETVPNEDDTLSVKFKQPTPLEQADEKDKNSNPDIYKPEVFDSHASLYKAIVPKLKKFGLENVGIKIMDSIENGRADGLWANKIIHVAMDSPNPMGTMRHESVHALRQLGGFKPNEWTVLTKKAKDEWVDKFIKKANLYDQYKDQYVKDNGNLTGFDDYIHEEAIAEAFKHFDQTKPPAGLVGNIYQRLKQFFETIRNGFEGNGFTTADSIFRSLDEGKRAPVALKEEAVAEGQPAPQYALKAPEGISQKVFDAYGKMAEADKQNTLNSYGVTKRNATMASRRYLQAVREHLISTGELSPSEEEVSNPAWRAFTENVANEYEKKIEQPSRYAIRAPLQNAFDYARGKDFKTNRDLKVDLQKIALQKNKQANANIENFDNKTIEYLSNLGVADALHAIKTNENAVGWYDVTVAKALNIISLLHPEIKTDPDAKFAFTWALAVTSNGMKVDKNFELAEEAYNYYKKNGAMPTNIQAGQAQKGINNGLKTFNEMVAKYGIDNTRKFMATEFTPKEIEDLTGLKILGENVGTKLLGASIIGPKIGNGFYSNLNGIFDKLTMDRWLMRTWGRWTGTLIENNVAQTKASKTLVDTLLRQMVGDKETKKNFEQVLKKSITKTEVKTEEGRALLAKNIAKATVKAENRDVFNRTTLGEDLRKASNNLAKYLDGQKEAPKTGTERNQIRAVFDSMLKKLQARGYNDLTMADLQALLWYPERRLYDVAKESDTTEGYDDSEAPDYANAAAKLVKENGITEAQIDKAIKQTEKQYANRARGVQPNAGGNAPQTSTQGKTRGFTEEERAKFSEQYAPPKPEKAPRVKKEKYSLRAPNTPAFKRWFGDSKIVNEDGTPKVMYHGTAQDISEFRPKQANAIFVTDSPKFAETFSDYSEDYLVGKYMENASDKDALNIINRAIDIELKEKNINRSAIPTLRAMDLISASRTAGIGDTVKKLVKEKLSSGQNILPVFVRSEKPFDYENPDSIEKIYDTMSDEDYVSLLKSEMFPSALLRNLQLGNWRTIEKPEIQKAIKNAGFDGFYVKEGGQKNLAVYEPTQLKSATGNQGTFDITSPDIRYALRASKTPAFQKWFGDSIVINEQGEPQIVYTGTSKDKDFTSFNVPKNGTWFTTNPEMASQYAIENDSMGFKDEGYTIGWHRKYTPTNTASRVIPTFLKIENPFQMTNEIFQREIGKQGSYKRQQAIFFDKLRSQGYDGIDMGDGIWVVLNNPNQIKSAFNMNPTEKKDMRYSIYPGPRLTKIETPKSTVNVVKDTASGVWDNIHNDDYLTKKRVEWIDKISGLTKSLQGLPQFDMNGKLRADLLLRAKAQGINYIKNAIQSGIPILNTDGTLGVQRSENNLARSLILADGLDSKFKQFGFTGRSGVAEVARILRGEEIMKEDATERAKGDALVKQANAHLDTASKLKKLHKFELEYAKKLTKEAKVLYNAGKLREGNLKASEARRIYETNFYREILKETKEARKLMREGKPLQKVFREFQVTDAKIQWANNILKRIPETENVLGIWRIVNRGLVDLWVDTGILDEQTAAKYKARDRYVPLFKSREDLDAEGLYNSTGTGTKSTAKIKTLKGAMIDRNIWENMDKHFAKMVAQAYENQTRRVGIDQLKYFGLAMDTTDREKANLFYKENGKEKMAIVENPNDLAAFQAMTYEISPLMKVFVPMTKVLRTGALLNPMYWIKQLIRDPIHASLVANSGIVTPFHSMAEFAQILAKNSEEAKILADRGVIGAVDNTMTMNEFLKQVGKEKTEPHALANALHKIMEIHEASDAATRVAIYKKAYAEGMKKFNDKQKATDFAVFKARESINFSVHGNSPILQSLRASIPFFSAAITSLDTVYRAATGYGLNEEEKAQARRIFASRAAMLAFMSTMYAMLYQDDDEYKKLPDYVKDENWLIPTPDGKTFIKIPTPYEVGFLFKTIPEGAVRYMSGTSTGKEVIASYYAGLLHNLPANGIPVPQAVKPILETITNHSFFTNHPIEGMSDQGLPVSMRGQRASEFSKMLSRIGLDGIGLSPAKIDNLFQGYFAELGTFSTALASDVVYMAEGKTPPAKNIENMAFMKSFLTDPNVSKAVSDFYSLEANAKQMASAINRFKSEGNIEGINAILSDEDKKKAYMSEAPLRKIGEEMTKIRKAINFYKENQSIDPEERRKKINELTQIYNKIAESGYTVADAIGVNR